MKTVLAKMAEKFLTGFGKKQALTGCFFACHNPEIPEELL